MNKNSNKKKNSLTYKQIHLLLPLKKPSSGAFFNRKYGGFFMVEAALVFPIFLCFFTMFLTVLFQLDVQRKVKLETMEMVRQASYLSSDEAMGAITSLKSVSKLLKKDVVPILILPETTETELGITVIYKDQSPYRLFVVPWGHFSNQVKVRKWIGENQSGTKEDLVYVTKYGSVYHEDRNCTYLKPQISKVSLRTVDQLRNQSGEKYKACKYCRKQIEEEGWCYITLEGNRFHRSTHCWELERDIYQIPRSEVGNRKPCSKCKGGTKQSY